MKMDKQWLTGSTSMLLLKLLDIRDMYGYQMIEELERRSENVFSLKAGTMYPLLHTMEQKGLLTSYEQEEGGRMRKYYHLTEEGRKTLHQKQEEWKHYSRAMQQVMEGSCWIYA